MRLELDNIVFNVLHTVVNSVTCSIVNDAHFYRVHYITYIVGQIKSHFMINDRFIYPYTKVSAFSKRK
jgi:hypothetical protein